MYGTFPLLTPCTSMTPKIMGFFPKKVWGIGYHRFMGFWYEIPANQLGGLKILWVFTGYVFTGMGYYRFDCIDLSFLVA